MNGAHPTWVALRRCAGIGLSADLLADLNGPPGPN